MRPGVSQVLALEVDARAAQLVGQALGVTERGGPPDIVAQQAGELGLESRVGLGLKVGALQFGHRRHEHLGHELPAVRPKLGGQRTCIYLGLNALHDDFLTPRCARPG